MDEKTKLNKNEEFVGKCLHMRKFKHGRIKGTSEVDLLSHTILKDPVKENLEVGERSGLVTLRRSCRNRKENPKYKGGDWTK